MMRRWWDKVGYARSFRAVALSLFVLDGCDDDVSTKKEALENWNWFEPQLFQHAQYLSPTTALL